MKLLLYSAAVIADIGIVACIHGFLHADPVDNECEYCDDWLNTYTGKDGKQRFVCEKCCFNPENKKSET